MIFKIYFSNIFIYSQSVIFIDYQVDVKQFPNPVKYIKCMRYPAAFRVLLRES